MSQKYYGINNRQTVSSIFINIDLHVQFFLSFIILAFVTHDDLHNIPSFAGEEKNNVLMEAMEVT